MSMLIYSKWAISKATEVVWILFQERFLASSKVQRLFYWIQLRAWATKTNPTVKIARFYELSACCEVHVDFKINSRKWDSFLWLQETGNVSTKEALQHTLIEIHANRCTYKTKRRAHHVAQSWQPVANISCYRLLQSFSITVIHYLYSTHSSHCVNGLTRIARTSNNSCVCTEHHNTVH